MLTVRHRIHRFIAVGDVAVFPARLVSVVINLLMKLHPFVAGRIRWIPSVVGVGVLMMMCPCPRAQAQPATDDGESLVVPDEATTAPAPGALPVIETAAQKAAKADREAAARDRALWGSERDKDRASEGPHPAEAVAAYQSWLTGHPTLHPLVVAEASVLVARLQTQSGDKDGASQTLSALWDKSSSGSAGLVVRAAQAQMLLEGASNDDKAKAAQQAQTMLEPLLPQALEVSHQLEDGAFLPGRDVMQRYADALQAQDKGLEVAAFATKVMTQAPEHLVDTYQNEGGWLYRTTVEALLADARPEAPALALSWAKLNWVERSFDANSIKAASSVVAQALLAQPQGRELLSQWAKAQKDPSAPNPLKEVALPVADSKALSAWLDTSGQEKKWQRAQVSVWLWLGHDHEAMQAAVAGAGQLPPDAKAQRQEVMREVARVFKARDLNLKRANAYLGWVSKPVGDNPIDVFLKEAPAKDGAAVVPTEAKTP